MITNKNISSVIKKIKKEIKKFDTPAMERVNKNLKDPFWTLIGCILSLRTKDTLTEKVVKKLYEHVKTPQDIIKLNIKKLEKLLYPVGFYKRKSRILKKISKIIIDKYNGEVPDELDELLTLPGVGRKTANLVITVAFNKDGICVDTHVHKIFNRWGYLKTKNPDETELELRKKLPKKYWKKINYYLVTFGQNICLSISPLCSKCSLNNICPKINVKKYR